MDGMRLARKALREYLARSGAAQPATEAVDEVLLSAPFTDPEPDPRLSVNVDRYLYGVAEPHRKTKRGRRRRR